jgi:hypothetical protein
MGFWGTSGCGKEGDLLMPVELGPPTNLRTNSGDAKVSLTWSASSDIGSNDIVGYRIVTRDALNAIVDSTNIAATASSYTIDGLVNDTIYTFAVQSVKSTGVVSQRISIQGRPTVRQESLKLYEYELTKTPRLQFLAGQRFNFAITNKTVRFFQQRWRHTLFVETTALRCDDFVIVPDISAFRSTPGLPIVSGKVYVAITHDGTYMKFKIEPPGVLVDPANNKSFVNITVANTSGAEHRAKSSTLGRSR